MNDAEILNIFSIEFNSGIPVYKQIINQVCSLVNSNVMREGDQLPTIRSLTEILGINPNTVAKAFRELELKGIISSQRGRGSYIASNPNPDVLSEKKKLLKINELYSKMVAEANSFGISEIELKKVINNQKKGKEE